MSGLDDDELLCHLDSQNGTSTANLQAKGGHSSSVITLELWKQADEEKEQLFDLMAKVQQKLNKKSNAQHPSVNPRCCRWEEVVDEAQAITKRRDTDDSKISRMMRCINKVGRHSSAFQSWLGLLPAGDYGSSICGAFKLVIGAAGQFAKVEETILDVLADIPEALEDARDYIRIYSDQRDQALERRTFDLFRTILKTLKHVMQFYADSSARKLFEPMLKQSLYKNDLIQSLSEVKKNVTRIKDEADKCLARRILEQESRISETRDRSEQGLVLLKSIYDHLLNGNNAERVPVIRPLIGRSQPESDVPSNSWGNGTSQVVSSIQEARQNAKHLMKLLRYDQDLPTRDTAACLTMGQLIDEHAKARAAALVCNTKFRTSMTGRNVSSALLVNGHADLGSSEGLSPLSLIAAKFAVLAEATGSAFVVKYFAGQHRPGLVYDVSSSAVGVVASIVCQLLNQMIDRGIAVNLAFLTKADWQHIEKRSLSILCIVFRELTNQLPSQSMLFCIIDEISLYETSQLGPDTDAVMRRLTRLVRNHDTITFKLLVTCQGRALGIGKYFGGNVVDLEEDIEADDTSTWRIAVMKGL